MQQEQLFHEDFEGALATCVARLGGAKVVGVMLRPEYEKDPDKAARWLLACLNPNRDERLSYPQQFKIMQEAQAIGCHAAMNYITRECSYADAQPIQPEDEAADLERKFVDAVDMLAEMTKRIASLRSRKRAQ